MKSVWGLAIILGFISLIVGMISRITMRPLAIVPGGGLEAEVLLTFTNTCFLIAITFILLEQLKAKK
jgi:hypothetical protein